MSPDWGDSMAMHQTTQGGPKPKGRPLGAPSEAAEFLQCERHEVFEKAAAGEVVIWRENEGDVWLVFLPV